MSPGRREFFLLGGVAAAAAVAGALAGAFALQSRSGAVDLLSTRLSDLEGRARRLSEWQGRTLLCNFWATWCAPCREELPLLDATYRQNARFGLQVVGIAVDNAVNVQGFLRSTRVTYPILVAGASAADLLRQLGNAGAGLPFSVGVDAAGRIRHRKLGAYSAGELKQEVAALLR